MNIKTPRLVPDILLSPSEMHPGKTAVRDPERSLSYQSLCDRVRRLSFVLSKRLGLVRGDAVAILLEDGVSFVEAHFGVLHSGCISVPLDREMKSRNLTHIFEAAQVKAVITDRENLLHQDTSESRESASMRIACLSEDGRMSGSDLLYEEAILKAEPEFKQVRGIDGDPAVYMFTTGSTGYPKGVVLTHAQILSAIRNIIEFVGYRDSDHELVTLPLSHSFGLGHVYCNLAVGGSVTVLSGIGDFKALFRHLFQYQPSGMPGTPSGFKILCRLFPSQMKQCGSFLKRVIIDSEPTPVGLIEQLLSLLPHTHIMIYYGLTEASRSTFINMREHQDRYHFQSVGRPSPNVAIKIVDDKGDMVEPGTTGRVMIRGTHIMKGYLGQPQETNVALQEGWLVTDDIGYLDREGYLFLTGRRSTFINKGGLKIDPGEIESVLRECDGVIDAAVLGMPADIGGEEIVGCVVVDRERCKSNDLQTLKEYCCAHLEAAKIPARIIALPSIPRNKTGKLLRQELKDAITRVVSP